MGFEHQAHVGIAEPEESRFVQLADEWDSIYSPIQPFRPDSDDTREAPPPPLFLLPVHPSLRNPPRAGPVILSIFETTGA